MARDLSVHQPLDPEHQYTHAAHDGRAPPHQLINHQARACARTPLPDRVLESSSESEGDGGGDSDQSYGRVGDHVSELDGPHREGLQGEHLYRQFLDRRLAEEQ